MGALALEVRASHGVRPGRGCRRRGQPWRGGIERLPQHPRCQTCTSQPWTASPVYAWELARALLAPGSWPAHAQQARLGF